MYVELIVIALAAALSPIVISAFTRVVFSDQRAVAVPAFVLTVGVLSFVLPLIVARTFGAATGHSSGDDATKPLDVIAAAALAVLLLAFAAKNLRKSRTPAARSAGGAAGQAAGAGGSTGQAAGAGPGGDGDSGGGSLGLRGALGLGAAVVVLNPKTIALLLAAGDVIGTETEALAEAAVAALVFAVACVGPIGGVAVYQAVGGDPAAARISAAEAWMQRNGPMIKAVVLGLIGAFFTYKAITGLGKL